MIRDRYDCVDVEESFFFGPGMLRGRPAVGNTSLLFAAVAAAMKDSIPRKNVINTFNRT